MYAIMCHDGKFLCVDGTTIVRKPLSCVVNVTELVMAVEDHGHWVLQDFNEGILDPDSLTFTRSIITDRFIVDRHHNDRITTIRKYDRYLRSNEKDGIDFCAVTHGLWESFRFFEINIIKDILHLTRNEWVRKSTKKISKIDFSKLESGFIYIDDLKVNINNNFPFINKEIDSMKGVDSPPNSIILHLDGWKPEEFMLYKPVIMYAFFGKGLILDQFKISISSLFQVGEFSGKVLIITNNSEHYVKSAIDEKYHSSIEIFYMYGIDQQDYVDCRISIFNKKIIYEYQPFLYLDLDVVVDLPINDFLNRLVCSEKCSAQIEEDRFLTKTTSCGSTLYSDDSFPINDDSGFNGGIIGIPNFYKFGRYLRASAITMYEYMGLNGRQSIPYDDQSLLNFCFRKFDIFSGNLITPMVSIPSAEKVEFSKQEAMGFAHFWPCIYREDRAERMKIYLNTLLSKNDSSMMEL